MDVHTKNRYDNLIGRCLHILPYVDLLFFGEIFYLMSLLFILYGKVTAVATGFLFIVALLYIIFSTYFLNEKGRIAQLLWCDGHVAFSFSYIILFGLRDHTVYSSFDWTILVFRSLLVLVELFYIYLLTSEKIKQVFQPLSH